MKRRLCENCGGCELIGMVVKVDVKDDNTLGMNG